MCDGWVVFEFRQHSFVSECTSTKSSLKWMKKTATSKDQGKYIECHYYWITLWLTMLLADLYTLWTKTRRNGFILWGACIGRSWSRLAGMACIYIAARWQGPGYHAVDTFWFTSLLPVYGKAHAILFMAIVMKDCIKHRGGNKTISERTFPQVRICSLFERGTY